MQKDILKQLLVDLLDILIKLILNKKATTFAIAFSLVEHSIELSNDFIEDWK